MSTTVEKTTDKKADGPNNTPQNPKRFYSIAAIVCFIIATGVAWMGINELSKTRKIKKDFTRTEAVVVDCEEDTYYDRDDDTTTTTYTVHLEYTAGAEVYKYKYESRGKMRIGDTMAMYYNPDNPKVAFSAKDLSSQVGEGLLYFALVAFLVVVGVVFLYTSMKKS